MGLPTGAVLLPGSPGRRAQSIPGGGGGVGWPEGRQVGAGQGMRGVFAET